MGLSFPILHSVSPNYYYFLNTLQDFPDNIISEHLDQFPQNVRLSFKVRQIWEY